MEALICDCCERMYLTQGENSFCDICSELAQLRKEQEFLQEYVDKQLDDARTFVMNYMGNAAESNTYHFHLGQATALQDMKNLLYVHK